ncbi:MAG: aminopeptidase P family protein [Mesorhizobium sp.]|uniref:M24 family metallopeptidase n=1 Tax=Mesorhizobium sp. TaxID=1871066 RepID=UPI000FE6D913|nr:Xaa-Pro peptidase family protein [Mesorhizobium sp.]RWF79105.1 MAG: aminopeptidase P family protein [Mesorhizobium sp.]TJW50091.1 MAG: aminopeptidase P family protein [Mesorhizobium sp.]
MTVPKGFQPFPRSEYLDRLTRVKKEMSRRALDMIFVVDEHNMTYLTGYLAISAYVPQGVIITMAQEEPLIILRQCDAPAGLHQCFMAQDKVIHYSEDLIGNPREDGFDMIIKCMLDLGAADASVGVELTAMPSLSADKFRKTLGNNPTDITRMVTWLRLVKSDLEIEAMREAAAISDAAMLRAAEVIRPGVREADASAEIIGTLIRGANGKPGSRLASFYMCASPRIGTCHIPWAEDEFREGSQINLELGGVRHGYVSGLMRTYSIGKPSDRLQKVHDIQVSGLKAALQSIKPGATCSDVANAFYSTIGKQGLKKDTRCGYAHGIGWLEPTASLRDGDMTVLEPNMTFH